MEEINESEFDKLVTYTLRVELEDGKVVLYRIDTENKNYLINKLRENSDGDYDNKTINFLWFETSAKRMVFVNIDFIVRVTFCFDYSANLVNPNSYYDNFNQLSKETFLKEQETKEGEVQLHVVEDHYLPQVIILHKGKAPDDNYDDNPLTYCELQEGSLEGFELELEGDLPFRQFLNLIDNDGEETFIPTRQIIVMEFDSNLVFNDGENDMDDDADMI